MNITILYENDTELSEYEAYNKGYRDDVVVLIGEKKYKIYIISILRLKQDFETEYDTSGYYMSEPNMLIVKEVTKKEIEYIINEMYKCSFFERLDNNGYFI